MNDQAEFNFEAANDQDGYTRWLVRRQVLAKELARRIHLPLGQDVEVWLHGGIRLRGRLKVKEEMQFMDEECVRHLELMVEHVVFTYRDLESCVRID